MLKRSDSIQSLAFCFMIVGFLCACNDSTRQNEFNHDLFTFNDDATTRWSSPENRNGLKGSGGKDNGTAKGHPFDAIKPGESYILLQTDGPGIINRIWVTINNRSPQMLRSLRLDMYWDGSAKPAVSVPFGDFFGVGLGKTTVFENALFANPEGRSFVSFIQMPFKRSAKIVLTNESNEELSHCYYDVDYSLLNNWNNDWLYFHAYWHRDTATKLAQDFELLPNIEGRGRYLGVNIGVNGNPVKVHGLVKVK